MFQWKMGSNGKLVLRTKFKKAKHPPLVFNNGDVFQVNSQKQLRVIYSPK